MTNLYCDQMLMGESALLGAKMLIQRLLMTFFLGLCIAQKALAALDVGDNAPDFAAAAAKAGKPFSFSLSSALAKGPVVLYFFPAAFSEGCSIEAATFADAIDQFEAMGATVVGVSRDDIDVLTRFSMEPVKGRFSLASDPSMSIAKSFDAVMRYRPEFANRISYVIAPTGKVVYSYLSLDPDRHVSNTLEALRKLQKQPSKPVPG